MWSVGPTELSDSCGVDSAGYLTGGVTLGSAVVC